MKSSARTVALLFLLLLSASVFSQVDVLTRSYNNARTGANLNETVLNTTNVNAVKFGKLYARNCIGQIYCQPLVVNGVAIPKVGTRNLVIVATEADNVYAWDATSATVATPYWAVNLATPMPSTYLPNGYNNIAPNIGITGTPVIDKPNNLLYVVSKGIDGFGVVHLWLNAIDIRTGKYRPTNGITEITASVSGVGAGQVGGTITLQPLWQMNRPALLLQNGTIYVALGSHGDMGPYHGWLLAYNASTFAQEAVYCDTQDGGLGGIWMSGQGPSADADGNVYFVTGNGSYDYTGTGYMTGNSAVELNLSGNQFNLVSFFTPFNSDMMNYSDDDLGSAGAVLLPDVNEILIGGKTLTNYLLQPGNLGGYNTLGDYGGSDNVLQEFLGQAGHLHGSPVYWNSPDSGPSVYIWSEYDHGKRYQFVNNDSGWLIGPDTSNPTPIQQTPEAAPNGEPGAILTLSANGSTAGTGILWAVMPWTQDASAGPVPGVLRAFDASNINHEIWNSTMVGGDFMGDFAKFTPVTVANGYVYVPTFTGQLVVFGLLSARQGPPVTIPPPTK